MTKKIDFMCTAFRDGFQSAFGARVLTPDFLPALEAARDAGIDYFEAGGGARFQSLYFYCNEDAFDMMDSFRATAGPNANLQTLSRGVNVVGLDSQSSDVIKAHADLFKKHGITTIRNFDALNDVNNLIYSGQCIAQAGLKHQVVVTMMELPPGCEGAHDADFYERTLKAILDADIPYDSVCFKDASGTSAPAKVYETIKRARKLLGPDAYIHFHTHETAGVSVAGNLAAMDAGCNAIDLSLAPCSGGTCQPDVLVMWHAMRGGDFALDIDVDKVRDAEDVFKDCMKDYFVPPEAVAVEPMIPWSPMPGGALTANTQMMRDNNTLDRYPEVIKAMSEVVRRGGYGTSVTPVSQFYFQQAYANVMFGPWKRVAESYGRMVLGYFGKTPAPPDPKIVKLAQEQLGLEPTTQSPLEMNDADPEKGLEAARKLLKADGLPETDENLFIAATCKEKGITFLKGDAQLGVRKKDPAAMEEVDAMGAMTGATKASAASAPAAYSISVNDKEYFLAFEGNKVTVDGSVYQVAMKKKAPIAGNSAGDGARATDAKVIVAEMPGVILKVLVKVGESVKSGQSLLVMEAMKMEVPISAPVSGTVAEMPVKSGDQVTGGQVLAKIG